MSTYSDFIKTKDTSQYRYNLIENYIYLYHVGYNDQTKQKGQFVVLPSYPESITDSLGSEFSSESPLSRSAPIFSYKSSGPRTVQVSLKFHREMMTQINYGISNLNVELGDDYVDTLIKQLQAVALPSYRQASKMVEPPQVAIRFGNDIFIKGVVIGGITLTYGLPILENNKYAIVDVTFQVTETDPYDAESVASLGSFRGLDRTLEKRLYKS